MRQPNNKSKVSANRLAKIAALLRKGFEINSEIVLSTAHLSEECAKALDRASRSEEANFLSGLCIYRHDEYGHRFFVPENDLFQTEFPELNAILQFAQKHGIDWVLFDCDGPRYKQFAVFEW